MSEQDEPAKAQAKARPEVPPKPPAPEPEPAPPAPALQNLSEGKVKSIVNKFSRQDSVSNETEQRHVNGSSKVTRIKRLKRPPTVKPKPKAGRASLPPQTREQAPPLPMKRSRKPKEAHPAEEDNHVHAEGSRSGRVIINEDVGTAGISGFMGGGVASAGLQPHSLSR